jgi:N utilization substance protein B
MVTRRKGRIIAFQALYGWEFSRAPVEDVLSLSWLHGRNDSQGNSTETGMDIPGLPTDHTDDVEDIDLTFPRLLVSGTLQNIEAVDAAIQGQLEHWSFNRVMKVDLAILRMSVYALLFQPDIPATVTIDEAIDIGKEFGADDSYKFINGVLDGIRKSHREDNAPKTSA